MGVFYHFHAVALAEDLPPMEEHVTSLEDFYAEVDRGYTQVSRENSSPTFLLRSYEFVYRTLTTAGLLPVCTL